MARQPSPQRIMPKGDSDRDGVDLATLRALLDDCDDNTLADYKRKGLIITMGRNRYNGALTVRNVIRHLRVLASGHEGEANGERISAVTENALLKRAQREAKLMEVAVMRGELLPINDVVAAWSDVITTVKQMVLAIPMRFATEAPHMTPHDRESLKRICTEVLRTNALANGYPPLPNSTPNDEAA